jgi:hypothetical protein
MLDESFDIRFGHDLRFFVDRNCHAMGYAFHIVDRMAKTEAQPLVMAPWKPYEAFQPPVFALSDAEAQGLLNELWRSGIRPSNGEGSVGQIGATERHLADMRAIAAAKLGFNGVTWPNKKEGV